MFRILLASLVLLAAMTAIGCCPCHHDQSAQSPVVALTK
jgi:hypothetical protein